MAGYSARQSTYTTGDTVAAADTNDEFNQLLAAFNATTGHTHDGTAGDGGPVSILRDSSGFNKVVIDNSNNHLEFYVNVSSSAVEQVKIQDGAIVPVTDNDIDLGTSLLEFKDLHLDGTANIDSLVADTADINAGTVDAIIGGTTPAAGTFTTLTANTSLALASGATVTAINDEDTMSSDSATALATQQSIKAYVDSQVTAQDLDLTSDSGTIAIDLDSETLTIQGTSNEIETSASGNALTIGLPNDVTIGNNLTVTGDLTVSGDDITMGTNTDTAIMVADGTNFNPVVPSGDVTLTNAGVFGIASGVIVNADINASAAIADSKLATISTADKVSGAAVQIDGATDGTSITIADSDKFLIDDGGTTKYVNASQINAYTSAAVALDDISTGDAASTLATSAGNITIDAQGSDTDIIFKGTDGGVDTTFLTIDGSEAGAATFNNKIVATELDISGNIDVDGTTNLDVVDIDGAVDMASTLQVDGAITSSTGAIITVSDNTHALELISTDADANAGPRLALTRNSASPADNDLVGDIRFLSEDDASTQIEYAKIAALALDVSNGSTDTELRFDIRHAGSVNRALILTPTEVVINDGSFDTDFRVESNNNTHALFIDAGNDTASFAVPITTTENINFGDNDKAIFGTGGDLEIYHSGFNSFIDEVGTGFLQIRSSNNIALKAANDENYVNCIADGAVELYHNAIKKLETTSSGVDVTGSFTATAGSTITTDDNSVTLTLQSTDDDSNVGPKLMLRRHSGSPADGDVIGVIEFHGQDDNDQQEDLVKLEAIFTDVSNGSEDVQFNINTKINGTNRSRIEMPPSETVFNEDSQDIDFRVETNAEANAFKIDGGSETAAFSVPVTFNDAANVAQEAITSSSNAVAWDATDKPNAYHLTTENTTFSAPSNAVEGAFICVEINYNGSHTIAWNTVFEFAASTAPTATSTDGKTDILVFRYNGSVWQEVGRTLNLSES
jgi:hypothetical protein